MSGIPYLAQAPPPGSPQPEPPTRWEFCIGAGGHQHYWDTAPDIAECLNQLIVSA